MRWSMALCHWRSLASGSMTIAELTGRIEQRLALVQEEILRLQAAADALDGESASAAGSPGMRCPRSGGRRPRVRAPGPEAARTAGHSAAGRDLRPGSAVALARELDAGLRNRV
jgi:hypothetical protein